MKIQIASDLHIEFKKYDIDTSDTDLLILAGDIDVGENGFCWIREKVKDIPVLYVLGNHEYYNNYYPLLLETLRNKAQNTNIHILENDAVTIDGVTFHGCTLWTDFNLYGNPEMASIKAQQSMYDYRLIWVKKDNMWTNLRPADSFLMHQDSVCWLKDSLINSNTSTNIVITHHAPSNISVPEKFRNKHISSAFASNLENIILETNPLLWVHGHMHNYSDYKIAQTRIICNPRGYPNEANNAFNKKILIDVNT